MSAFLTYAFRPLFLLATLQAIVVVPLWAAAWLGYLPMPSILSAPTWWHAHEMIYGFAGAAIGGFALTAVATWTRRPPISGAPLLILSLLWLGARLLFALPFPGLLLPAAVADLGYGTLLFILMSREVIGARSQRNYKVLLILGALPLTNALFFLSVSRGWGWVAKANLAGLWLVVSLINLIAGRVVPGFTRNWLKRRMTEQTRVASALPPPFDRFDLLATLSMLLFAVMHLLGAPPRTLAISGLVAGVLMLIRLGRWQGIQTASEPLVWVLHVAFLWLPVGLLLLSAAQLGLVPETAGIHALTSGAISTMVIAIAGRAALGHTGRPLDSHPVLTASYVFITLAAILRVAATVGPVARALLTASAVAWSLAFICFAWRYVPILTQGRAQTSRSLPTV